MKNTKWKDIKRILDQKEKSELLKLISDLYSSSADNKLFICSRYSEDENTLVPYKNKISDSLYPDVYKNKPIRLSIGKKAISDYYKATKDKSGQFELMVHYLETGNQFTVDFGDIDEQFYFSLESMFAKILSELLKQSTDVQKEYFPRLEAVVVSARDIGWGYYDYIRDIFDEFETEIDCT